MSVVTKYGKAFWLSLCLTLAACGGGGGGSSDGGGTPNAENPDTGGETPDNNDGTGDTGDTGGGDGSGDGGTGDTGGETPAEGAPTVSVASSTKQLKFTWDAQEGADHYILSVDPDGGSGFTELARIEGSTEATTDVAVHRHDWQDAAYIVEACSADGCVPSLKVTAADAMLGAIGYIKASNPDAGDEFGYSVALSEDGRTLAVGAHAEASGDGGDQSNNDVGDAGAVYVFTLGDAGWSQEAYIKASSIGSGDDFGHGIALSGDGNTLAVGATWDDEGTPDTGAAYVFTRDAGQWSEQARLTAANLNGGSNFGITVALSHDGNVLAVGAPLEDSAATGVNGNAADTSAADAGAAYLFTRNGSEWTQTTYVKASNTDAGDLFGSDVALSGDGTLLAVSAPGESSSASGINGDGSDNSSAGAGAVYLFTGGADGWTQQAYVKASETAADANFGHSVALARDGNTLAVGALSEQFTGAAYVFSWSEAAWTQQARLTASNAGGGDQFGTDVALNSDGSLLAVSAIGEDSAALGVGGDKADESSAGAGAVYMFELIGGGWTEHDYVKAPNTHADSRFGQGLALDGSGDTFAVGAPGEDSASAGVNGNQADQSADRAGAAYIY